MKTLDNHNTLCYNMGTKRDGVYMLDIIKEADAIIITAGAGMGVDSGLPDFRGDAGMWKAYPALGEKKISFSSIANPAAFANNPELAWAFYGHRYDLYKSTVPHEGFQMLLDLCKEKDHFVVTSNVDGQFQKAGFSEDKVYEIHGRIHTFQCTNCNAVWQPDLEGFGVDPNTLEFTSEMPKCDCGSLARPNIMMFGDYGYNSEISSKQEDKFNDFMHKHDKGNKIVIIEIGAGTAIPSIRHMGEFISEKVDGATLVRINPREAFGPEGTISVEKGGVEGLKEIL